MKIFHFLARLVATLAVFTLVIAGGVGFWWTKFRVPQLRQTTNACWAQIGRPMSKFERRLRSVAENSSFHELARELEPFGIKGLYRARAGEPNLNTIRLPNEVVDILNAPGLDRKSVV